jgi:DNA polymerase-1
MRRIAVIDGNSLMHRAFHAVPDYMMTPDGTHTNAVFGFVSMLLKLIDDFKPDGIICAFDAGIPAFRMEAIEVYKAQRPPTDPALKEQFPLMENVLRAMGIEVIRVDGYEGDDVLGTLSALGDARGVETYIVSGDRDIFQLASETTKIVATRVGLSDVKVYGPDEVTERYGIGPELVPDFIALKGDSSDNIPGVPGVGEKTAAKLLVQYGSAQGIIDHVDELKGKTATNIAENIDVIEAGRKVATIVRDLDIDVDFDSVVFPSFDPSEVVRAFKELHITSHVPKILALQDGHGSADTATPAADEKPVELIDSSRAAAFVDELVKAGETVAVLLDESEDGGMLFGASKKMVVCSGGKAAMLENDDIAPQLARIILGTSVVTVDSKELLQELAPADSSLPALIDIAEVDPSRIFDLGIAAYLLDSSRSSYGIEYLAFEFAGVQLAVPEKPKRGQPAPSLDDGELVRRAAILFEIESVLRDRLEQDGSRACFDDIEMPLVPVLVSLERAGLELDIPRVHELSEQIGANMAEVQSSIFELVGEEFNIGSPKQLSHILFEKLGLPAKKKSRTGYSTDASVLADLQDHHPVPGLVLEYRELSKIKSTYLDALPELVMGDGRLHTSFNQTITATGRLSSSNPNLQNIPVRTELGRQIRTAFGPYHEMAEQDGGAVFLSADYSQIELRLLAHLSGDEGLIDAFRNHADFHAATAAGIFGLDPSDVTPELRSRAKAVNFGIVYGQQAFGLARSLGISMREAQEIIDRYFTAYPQVKPYLDSLVTQAKTYGYVETMFGRKRHVPEALSKNQMQRQAGERIAMNHPMQGSAADIIKLAMIAVSRKLADFDAVMMLQVHDELDFSCPAGEIDRLREMVSDEMSHVVDLKVPLEVSVAYGETWADAK